MTAPTPVRLTAWDRLVAFLVGCWGLVAVLAAVAGLLFAGWWAAALLLGVLLGFYLDLAAWGALVLVERIGARVAGSRWSSPGRPSLCLVCRRRGLA